jgi:hypothetical protein
MVSEFPAASSITGFGRERSKRAERPAVTYAFVFPQRWSRLVSNVSIAYPGDEAM